MKPTGKIPLSEFVELTFPELSSLTSKHEIIGSLFSPSTTQMSQALRTLEIAGIILAVALGISSFAMSGKRQSSMTEDKTHPIISRSIVIALVVLVLAIMAFAAHAAMIAR